MLVLRAIPGKLIYPVRYCPYSDSDQVITSETGSNGDSGILDLMYRRSVTSDLNTRPGGHVQDEGATNSRLTSNPTGEEDTLAPSFNTFYASLEPRATRPNGVSDEMVWISPAYVIVIIIVADFITCLSS